MESDRPDRVLSPRLYHLAWFFYLLLAAAAVVWIGMRRGAIGAAVFFDPSRWFVDVVWGAAAGLALVGLWWIIARRFSAARRFEDLLSGLLGSLDTTQAIGLALLSGFAEELFFRGAVQDTWGIWVASALFAALHTGRDRGMWVWTAFALVAGLLFGGLVVLSGNLLAPMVAHVLVNAIGLTRFARRPPAPHGDVSSTNAP